jgi:uncharacterized protein DUF885
MEMNGRFGLVVAFGCVAGSVAFGQRLSPDSAMAPEIRRTIADEGMVRSFFGLRWSEARIDGRAKLADEGLSRFGGLDWDEMDVFSKADAVLLRHHFEGVLSEVDQSRARRAEMLELLPMLEFVERLERDRSEMAELDLEALAGQIGEISEQIDAVKERIIKPGEESDREDAIEVSATLALRVAGAVAGTRRVFEQWNNQYSEFEPGFSWWIETPFADAKKAMEAYEKYLRRDLAGQKGNDDDPLVGDPEGRDRLVDGLKREMIAYSPEELIEIGQRELAWCQEQMRLASNEMGFGDDFHAALEAVKDEHVPPGEQARLVTEQAEDVIRMLRERDLVTVPELAAELWRTRMITERGQRVLPFAAYSDNHVMVAYPTAGMDTDEKSMAMRGNNEHFTRIVVPHELIPGHHLQGFMASRVRTYRGLFRTPFFVEGWALYWEMVLWDMGYARSPEDRIGMLFWRSHRAARIIVSLKFHLGEMSPNEMIDFLVDEVGHERSNATSEVRRYINGSYSPLYQVAYMIGGLQIRALRREVVDGGLMSEKDFHDELLQHGSIPVEMIRAQMLGLVVEPDWEASWRFAGD